jgi:hypothetical protein
MRCWSEPTSFLIPSSLFRETLFEFCFANKSSFWQRTLKKYNSLYIINFDLRPLQFGRRAPVSVFGAPAGDRGRPVVVLRPVLADRARKANGTNGGRKLDF